jgi:hypothetical protein
MKAPLTADCFQKSVSHIIPLAYFRCRELGEVVTCARFRAAFAL